MPDKTSPIQVTIKWPSQFASEHGPALPERMVNVHADTVHELYQFLDELRHIGINTAALFAEEIARLANDPSAHYGRANSGNIAASEAANIAAHREPAHDEPEPEPEPTMCPKGHGLMIASQWGGQFCPARDDDEADGRCRYVHDAKGLRRKPARSELAFRQRVAVPA